MTPLEVAEALRVAPATLDDWRSGRNGPPLPFLRFGRVIRYRRADIDKLIADAVQMVRGGA
jgi:hypothetical protein